MSASIDSMLFEVMVLECHRRLAGIVAGIVAGVDDLLFCMGVPFSSARDFPDSVVSLYSLEFLLLQ
jgi:hypothetical protein